MSVFWQVTEDESGVHSAITAVGSARGGDDIVPSGPAARLYHSLFEGLSLEHNHSYWFTLEVTNNAGLTTHNDSMVTVDITPPTCTVQVVERYENTKTLQVSWQCQGNEMMAAE